MRRPPRALCVRSCLYLVPLPAHVHGRRLVLHWRGALLLWGLKPSRRASRRQELGRGERGGAPRGHSTASACRMSCGSVEWLLWGIADAAGVSATRPACSAHGRRARSGWAGSVEAGPWRLAALAPHIPCTRGVLAAEMWVCQLRGGCRDSRFAHQADRRAGATPTARGSRTWGGDSRGSEVGVQTECNCAQDADVTHRDLEALPGRALGSYAGSGLNRRRLVESVEV